MSHICIIGTIEEEMVWFYSNSRQIYSRNAAI